MKPSDPPLWPRRTVHSVKQPDLARLAQASRPWLWLNGASSQTLEADVMALPRRFDHHWLWRDTEWEFTAPGYRHGPLLVPLDEPLLQAFFTRWAGSGDGLILLTLAEDEPLIAHLQNLRTVTAADGHPVRFSLGALAQLEALAGGLPSQRLALLLGPIQALIWPVAESDRLAWRRANNPAATAPRLPANGTFALSRDDEAAIDLASRERFLREAAAQLQREHPALTDALGPEELCRRLTIFAREAHNLGFVREDDACHYLRLRLRHPQQSFEKDGPLKTLLLNRVADGRVRLEGSELRLQQLASTPA